MLSIKAGFIRNELGQIVFQKPSHMKGLCGCNLYWALCFYFTVLNPKCGEDTQQLKRLKQKLKKATLTLEYYAHIHSNTQDQYPALETLKEIKKD